MTTIEQSDSKNENYVIKTALLLMYALSAEAIIEFDFSKGTYSDKQKTIIQRAVETCPVAKSIHPELKLSITYKF